MRFVGSKYLDRNDYGHIAINNGDIIFNDVRLNELSVDERAKAGIFLAMQDPTVVDGVTNSEFLKNLTDYKVIKNILKEIIPEDLEFEFLHLTEYFISGYYSDDFSENISLCEDYAVLTYIVPKLKNAFYLHESLYKYRQHEGSICHNIGVQDLRNVYKLVNERYIYFTKCGFCVNNTGILLVEYRYLIYIVLRENLSENVENYQEIYAEMLQHLQKNRSVLLSSDVLSKKEKIILYLLIFDVKGIIYVLFRGWKLLKAIWK